MLKTDVISVLERPYASTPEGALRFFISLVDAIRPDDPHSTEAATAVFASLRDIVASNEKYRATLRCQVQQLLRGTQQVSLYTDAGILPNSGFFSELWRRAMGRILPPVPDAARLKDCFDAMFHDRDDHVWLAAGPLDDKLTLWDAVFSMAADAASDTSDASNEARWQLHTEAQLLEAMQVLATRIGAMGLEPELTRVQPRIIEFESPFVHLNAEVLHFAEAWRAHHADPTAEHEDERHIMVLVDQCRDVMARARRNAASEGTSLSLTYLLVRTEQCLQRLVQLTGVLCARFQPEFQPEMRSAMVDRWVRLTHDLVQGENRRNSLREPFSRLTGLLALRVTENAHRTGEHYITTDRAEYAAMWRSAAGGGFIVGFMALIKLLLGKFIFAPFVYVFMHSLNYSLGFVLIHVLRFTLATKQPAMTAATIAESIDKSEGKTRDLHRLADLVVAMMRSQFAAIAGNVAVAIPTAVVIALVYQWIIGQPAMDVAKAQHTLHDLSPIASLAIPHAALTGILLFLAGLLSGFFDNKAAYDRIPERIAHLGWLRRLIGPQRADRFANYIGRNLGSLAGNFLLGIMLASLAPLGVFLGLPLDVRHVTLSSANFAFALTALNFHIDPFTLIETLAGIALVGFTNLTVSFALALWVALKARGADITATQGLAALLLERVRKEPARFFVPPRA
ncbi:MAG: site-specific recombinase [Rugosibacter sp.]|nr:site-specific recombinase [Rugosibacter sp.]